jgi:hypothetical protein
LTRRLSRPLLGMVSGRRRTAPTLRPRRGAYTSTAAKFIATAIVIRTMLVAFEKAFRVFVSLNGLAAVNGSSLKKSTIWIRCQSIKKIPIRKSPVLDASYFSSFAGRKPEFLLP